MSALSATRWSPTMKRVVVGLLLAGAVFLIYRAGDIARPFLWASILGYILLPLVRVFEERLSGRRSIPPAVAFTALPPIIPPPRPLPPPPPLPPLHSFPPLPPPLLS